ncbi:hypothetical protein AB0B85_01315 [Micromonospora sp. NPDC049044]|uniref:hypothetical protein n=1 Tax=Micromonospora sp. NPDC049044 TaxID=3154827 RepID=UPI003400F146
MAVRSTGSTENVNGFGPDSPPTSLGAYDVVVHRVAPIVQATALESALGIR